MLPEARASGYTPGLLRNPETIVPVPDGAPAASLGRRGSSLNRLAASLSQLRQACGQPVQAWGVWLQACCEPLELESAAAKLAVSRFKLQALGPKLEPGPPSLKRRG